MTDTPHAEHHLDATGLVCPEPVMLLHGKVRDMGAGEVLEVRATDPSTDRDFQNFCRFLGHEMVASELGGEILEFWIKKSDK